MAKSSNIIEEKQYVRTGSILSMFALLAAIIFILAPAITGQVSVEKERALRKAESIAYQVIQIHSKLGRSPASELSSIGQMGQDPWGNPYNYKLIQEGSSLRVDIWTVGVNSIQTSVRIPQNRL